MGYSMQGEKQAEKNTPYSWKLRSFCWEIKHPQMANGHLDVTSWLTRWLLTQFYVSNILAQHLFATKMNERRKKTRKTALKNGYLIKANVKSAAHLPFYI